MPCQSEECGVSAARNLLQRGRGGTHGKADFARCNHSERDDDQPAGKRLLRMNRSSVLHNIANQNGHRCILPSNRVASLLLHSSRVSQFPTTQVTCPVCGSTSSPDQTVPHLPHTVGSYTTDSTLVETCIKFRGDLRLIGVAATRFHSSVLRHSKNKSPRSKRQRTWSRMICTRAGSRLFKGALVNMPRYVFSPQCVALNPTLLMVCDSLPPVLSRTLNYALQPKNPEKLVFES